MLDSLLFVYVDLLFAICVCSDLVQIVDWARLPCCFRLPSWLLVNMNVVLNIYANYLCAPELCIM
jgi:hypothetical protein